ncbi:FliG C-terminal domain-containing protein [Paracoccus spongiarum]|uniref:Flagellar motor switch protein FliG n=1 Tax=Paracoccus spongiarum TaxID=3064387 RepID=A0ABT9JD99_9RHOB|nr:FliG C-terminal domain-containing protein [Paracoccus sp. 2205BS29-5]MDP5307808.1 FliG C-terminal domain-containing protein [Paracoccus sp. 2205BS29-5]
MNAQGGLNQRQKAAVIVRLLLDDDEAVHLSRLDSESQTLLAEEMAGMELIDRQTRDAVIAEFCDRLESVGMTFPGDLDGTLAMLGGKLSDDSTDRLRRLSAMSGRGDPWQRVSALSKEVILTLATTESIELVALMLSKLPVSRASAVFSDLPRDRARAVAQAMSMTAGVTPEALHRVGLILLHAADALPRPAIDTPAADRMGAILNFATADLRDEVLDSLDREDTGFAEGVRRAIFIFEHIPARIETRDVPRIIREVEQPVLIRALSAPDAGDAAAAAFILANLSQRMADGLREEIDALGKLRPRDIDEAKTEVIAAIRRLEEAGELTLILPPED